MKKIKKIPVIFLCALSISACAYYPPIPKPVENSFSYCYNGENTGIDTLINIDGYYQEISLFKRSPTIGGFSKDTSIYYVDTSYRHFMFYDDGIFVYNIRDTYYDIDKKELIKKDVSSFLHDFAENYETSIAKEFYDNYWGGYIICGDTIKMQSMFKGMSLNANWHLREDWYKIIDKNTIMRINAFNLPTTEISQPKNKTSQPIIFFSIPTKPESDKSWILKEKWFWCNEEQYKEYKRILKESRKTKKMNVSKPTP
jgi:hypothetical protein